MSLYYEAAPFLDKDATSSIKSRVYGARNLKNKPAQVFALISEATKWSPVLSPIVDSANLLQLEKKLTPALALLLTHDLVLSKTGVAAPKDHVLRQTIQRHRARLNAEFTRARIKAKAASVDEWKRSLLASTSEPVEDDSPDPDHHSNLRSYPRWVRINTLNTTLEYELSEGVFQGWKRLPSSSGPALLHTYRGKQALLVDPHVANLVATPSGTDLTDHVAYKQGRIIFQDKASCFPATLLAPQTTDGDLMDACAAPGNKTTHLAALLLASKKSVSAPSKSQTIFAVERDALRSQTLQKMVLVAGANEDELVTCLARQDFLRIDTNSTRWSNVGALLLDPSCSGSGIVGRDLTDPMTKTLQLVLPKSSKDISSAHSSSVTKKRKCAQIKIQDQETGSPDSPNSHDIAHTQEDENLEEAPSDAAKDRLTSLSNFQLAVILHAFRFPAANKVVYSTCSIHDEENEHVVRRALASDVARQRGWRIFRRREQVHGMRKWEQRGRTEAIQAAKSNYSLAATIKDDDETVAQACLRCHKGTKEGTMGFFVVGFVRDDNAEPQSDVESEWDGLSNDE